MRMARRVVAVLAGALVVLTGRAARPAHVGPPTDTAVIRIDAALDVRATG